MDSKQTKYSDQERDRSRIQINMGKIDRILIDVQRNLRDSLEPFSLEHLNSFERKKIHSFFDAKADFETKTYRRNEEYILKVFPVGNLKREAKEKAEHVLKTGEVYTFPFLPGYERYVIHNYLQIFDGVETKSIGEDNERRLEIRPIRFGRTLKRIIKKIKIM
jgi:predicted RNA-binding protein Jag